METRIAKLNFQRCDRLRRNSLILKRQLHRRRHRHKLWWVDFKKLTDDFIVELIIFRTTDAVQEKITGKQTAEHGCRQCSRANEHVRIKLIQFLECGDKIFLCQNHRPTSTIRQLDVAVFDTDKQTASIGRFGCPNPKRNFCKLPVNFEFWHRMRSTANSVYDSILLQRFIVDFNKTICIAHQSLNEHRKRFTCRHNADRKLKRIEPVLLFKPMASCGDAGR